MPQLKDRRRGAHRQIELDLTFMGYGETRNGPLKTRFLLGDELGSGGQARVVETTPLTSGEHLWKRLGVPPGTRLACRITNGASEVSTTKRWKSLRLINDTLRRQGLTEGMVPVLATATRRGEHNEFVAYEIMPHAGEPLPEAERNRRWELGSQASVIRALIPMAKSLAAIHSIRPREGYQFGSATAHHDIKPSNVFVLWEEATTGGHVPATKAKPGAEYSISVRLGDPGTTHTMSFAPEKTQSEIPTSYRWAPPEMFGDLRSLDPKKADVFSFAETLFYALTSRHPWPGIEKLPSEPQKELLAGVLREYREHPTPPDHPLDLIEDENLRDLVRDCCLNDPRARPNMSELVTAMEAAAAGSHVTEDTAPLPLGVRSGTASRPDYMSKRVPRRPAAWALAAAIAAAVAVLLFIMPSIVRGAVAGGSGGSAPPTTPPQSGGIPFLGSPGRASGPWGWGPDRATYQVKHPADHAVLDSIIDNPSYGDERQFVQVKNAANENADYSTKVEAKPGDVIQAYVWVLNGASDNTSNPASLISDLTATLLVSEPSSTAHIQVTLDATAPGEPGNKQEIYASSSVSSDRPIRLEVLPNTFDVESSESGWSSDGIAFGQGKPVKLGLKGPDGLLPTGQASNGYEQSLSFFFKMVVIPG